MVSEISRGDRERVRNMQNNDPITRSRTIEALFERHAETLFAFLRLHTPAREDAEDILVETFTAALAEAKFAQLDEPEQKAWLWRVARNKAVDVFRKASVRGNTSLEQAEETICEDETRDPEQMALRQDEAHEVEALLQQLSAQQQEVLRLRYRNDLRCSEIALILGKRESAVRTMLSRTMNILRQLYLQRTSPFSEEESGKISRWAK